MEVCIFDIKRFAVHDGPGIRTTVFFKGCPLNCWWCHNPEGINRGPECYSEEVVLDGVSLEKEVVAGRFLDTDELMTELEKDRVFMEESGGGISFSGGEPLQQAAALFHLIESAAKKGLHTAVDTSGYTSKEKMEKLSSIADMILFDIKCIENSKHYKYTGVSNERIIENLSVALRGRADVHVRIPLVSGFNDSDKDIADMIAHFVTLDKLKAVDILPYHHFGTHKYTRFNKENLQEGFKTPSKERIEEIKTLFMDIGYRVSVGG